MKLRVFQVALGLGCTLFFLALALYRVKLDAVGAVLTHCDPIWIGAAVAVYAVNMAIRAWRWQVILRTVAVIPYGVVVRALVVGYGMNVILPARLGELFRAEYFKRTYGLSRVWALTSIVIERLFDGVAVILCLAVGLYLAATTGENAVVLRNVLITAVIVFGAILLIALVFARTQILRPLNRFSSIAAQVAMVKKGLEVLRTWRTVEVAALTLLTYVPDTLSLWCIVRAVGLPLQPADALVLVGAASLSTLVPSGPAFLGTLQFAYALAIEFAGGTRALGVGAATLAQLCLLLPLAISGAAIVVHGSGIAIFSILTRRAAKDTPADG